MERYQSVSYQGIEFGKYHGMFTNLRLDRTELPKDVYPYDIRESDCTGCLISIEPVVRVNHGGTVLLMEPIKMPKGRDYYTLRNWTFTDDCVQKGKIDDWFEQERGLIIAIQSSYLYNDVIDTPERMPYKVETKSISNEWKKNLEEMWWYSKNIKNTVADSPLKKKMFKLRDALLSFGGEEVCLPSLEEDIDNILNRGQAWMGDKVDMMRGQPSQCHSNSAACWQENKSKTTIATGYALSEDGLWRQHSWVIHLKPRQNRVVETTKKRLIYYGFAMTEKECEDFAYWNS